MEELLNRLKRNDKEAFEEIIRFYENDLLTIAKYRIGDEHLAKDALQETFLSFYLNSRKIKDYTKLKSWLSVVLINKCNDIMRKNKIIQVSFEDNNFDDFIYLEKDVDKILDKISFSEIINCLNVDERTIISMYYAESYTVDEIADILRMKTNTVKSKIARAKAKLRNKLGEENGKI